ncbi:MAG: hypothetical protein ABSE66_00940 [Thermoplasmata archaeon]
MSVSGRVVVPAQETGGYQIPSLGYRILVAALRLIPSFFLLVALPVAALTFVNSRGIALPISIFEVEAWGLVLLALGTARYISKPTRAYGPLSVAVSLMALLYLLYALTLSPYRLVIPGGSASVAAGYSMFLELAMVVPAIGIVVGLLITFEDARSPKERLPFDYPA